jgi:hypothetical protein
MRRNVVNRVCANPLFHDQLIRLIEQVEALARKNLAVCKEEAATKLLAKKICGQTGSGT